MPAPVLSYAGQINQATEQRRLPSMPTLQGGGVGLLGGLSKLKYKDDMRNYLTRRDAAMNYRVPMQFAQQNPQSGYNAYNAPMQQPMQPGFQQQPMQPGMTQPMEQPGMQPQQGGQPELNAFEKARLAAYSRLGGYNAV